MTSSFRPAAPRASASILLVDNDGRVLVGERSRALPFMPGFTAFPGGRADAGDEALALALFGRTDPVTTLRATALRELFEETGIVLDGARAIEAPTALASTPLAEVYRTLGIGITPEHLIEAGRWVTPESVPLRFDTQFFLARTQISCRTPSEPGELSSVEFAHPERILAEWRALKRLVAPPTRSALEALALGLEGADERLIHTPEARGRPPVAPEAIFGIRTVALLTPTLPPAHHTNTYVIGEDRLLIVDPATYDTDERDKLLGVVEALVRGGAKVEGVLLTHHHADHVGSAEPVARALDAPILAHARTATLLSGRARVDRSIEEGERLDLGAWSGPGRFELEILVTPGHAPGHVVLADRRPGEVALVVGDMLAGLGTIVIDPPEGDMAEYLRQLHRLRARPPAVLFPAHGPLIVDGHAKIDEYIAHRLAREARVLAALEKLGEASPRDLVAHAYADTPGADPKLAARTCLAHLEKLVEDGSVDRQGDRFFART